MALGLTVLYNDSSSIQAAHPPAAPSKLGQCHYRCRSIPNGHIYRSKLHHAVSSYTNTAGDLCVFSSAASKLDTIRYKLTGPRPPCVTGKREPRIPRFIKFTHVLHPAHLRSELRQSKQQDDFDFQRVVQRSFGRSFRRERPG